MLKSGPSNDESSRISGVRAGRLFRLLKLLASGPLPRGVLLKRLKVGMRTFYRDVDLLRECGIDVQTRQSGYELAGELNAALDRIPYPDPELTFGDIMVLMKGRSSSHQKLRRQFDSLTK